jgi:hypothetical protein
MADQNTERCWEQGTHSILDMMTDSDAERFIAGRPRHRARPGRRAFSGD